MRQSPQGELIALGPKSRNRAIGTERDIGMMPEFLALVHVRDMHLDHRRLEGVQGVQNGDRGVGEGSGIDDDPAAVSRAS
jgi:hypothetical protein